MCFCFVLQQQDFQKEKHEKLINDDKAKTHMELICSLDRQIRSISEKIKGNIMCDHNVGKEYKYPRIEYLVDKKPFVGLIIQNRKIRLSVALEYEQLEEKHKAWTDPKKLGKNHVGLGIEKSFKVLSDDVVSVIKQAYDRILKGDYTQPENLKWNKHVRTDSSR